MNNYALIAVVVALFIALGATQIYFFYDRDKSGGQEQTSPSTPSQDFPSENPAQTAPAPATPTQRQPQKYEVEIEDFAFNPPTITIKSGDSVEWRNRDSVQHSVISDSGQELKSSLLNRDEIYLHTFNSVGNYAYHCGPHPRMKGTIIVEE